MSGGQGIAQLVDVRGLRYFGGQHEVDGVRHVLHAPLHVSEDVRDLVRKLAREAQHWEAAGAGERDGYVDAVREAEDRVADS